MLIGSDRVFSEASSGLLRVFFGSCSAYKSRRRVGEQSKQSRSRYDDGTEQVRRSPEGAFTIFRTKFFFVAETRNSVSYFIVRRGTYVYLNIFDSLSGAFFNLRFLSRQIGLFFYQ